MTTVTLFADLADHLLLETTVRLSTREREATAQLVAALAEPESSPSSSNASPMAHSALPPSACYDRC
jgi:hypothetical protein